MVPLTDKCEDISRGRERHAVDPSAIRTGEIAADGSKRESISPDCRLRPDAKRQQVFQLYYNEHTHFASMPLMNAEKTYALASAAPAARRTLFGCQSISRTVDRRGFLMCFETHQLFSSSKEHTAMVLRAESQLAKTV